MVERASAAGLPPASFRGGDRPSVWLAEDDVPSFAPLQPGAADRVDVCVVGGGIVGLTTAVLAARRGARVVLLEARHVGAGTTARSTAKASAVQGLRGTTVAKAWGRDAAAGWVGWNLQGLELLRRLCGELGGCGWEDRPSSTWVEDPGKVDRVAAEAEVLRSGGVDATVVPELEMPFRIAAAVVGAHQGQVDPVQLLVALAGEVVARGGSVHEGSRVTSIDRQSGVVELGLEGGAKVAADRVVVATHLPVLERGLFSTRLKQMRSYALSGTIGAPMPEGMHLGGDEPSRSLRPLGDGRRVVVGGDSQRVGQDDTPERRWLEVARWASDRLEGFTPDHAWSAHDQVPLDHLPMVGKHWFGDERVLTATGFSKWGFTQGAASALLLDAMLAGTDAGPMAKLLDSTRLDLPKIAKPLAAHGTDIAVRFVGDRVAALRGRTVDDLQPGEADVVIAGAKRVAAYRDEEGCVHAVSPVCTHQGCNVRFNRAERSWDCPCHGSRFSTTGEVLQGPAVRPLEQVELDQEAAR